MTINWLFSLFFFLIKIQILHLHTLFKFIKTSWITKQSIFFFFSSAKNSSFKYTKKMLSAFKNSSLNPHFNFASYSFFRLKFICFLVICIMFFMGFHCKKFFSSRSLNEWNSFPSRVFRLVRRTQSYLGRDWIAITSMEKF